MSWQTNFMHQWIGGTVGHAHIFLYSTVCVVGFTFFMGVAWIRDKRHLGHFVDGNCWEVVIDFNGA